MTVAETRSAVESASLDIVIVAWQSAATLARAIASARAAVAAVGGGQVTVVANEAGAMADLPDDVTLLRNPDNRGFAAGCNQGVAAGRAPALLFLNPDAELPVQTALAGMARLQDGRPETAIIGFAMHDGRGVPQPSAARFPGPLALSLRACGLHRLGLVPPPLYRPPLAGPVDQPIGAAFLIRRDVFAALGGFDERFFMYYEELDLCRRAAARGWRAWHLDQPVHHLGGVSAAAAPILSQFHNRLSRCHYAGKHFGLIGWCCVLFTSLLAESLVRSVVRAVRGDWQGLRVTAAASLRLWINLPALIAGRRVTA